MSRRAGWKRPVKLQSLLAAGLLFAAAAAALAANAPARGPASQVQPNRPVQPNKPDVPKVIRQKVPVNNAQDGSGTDNANRGTPPAGGGRPPNTQQPGYNLGDTATHAKSTNMADTPQTSGQKARTETVGKDEAINIARPPGGTTGVKPVNPQPRPGGAFIGAPGDGQGI